MSFRNGLAKKPLDFNYETFMKSHNTIALVVSVLVGYSLCNCAFAEDSTIAEPVPMVRVLSNPKDFEGKTVMTIGYAVIEFENCALFLSQEHAKVRDKLSSVWLTDSEFEKLKPFSGKWVLLVGKFSINRIGTNDYCGEFNSIRSIDEWPSKNSQ